MLCGRLVRGFSLATVLVAGVACAQVVVSLNQPLFIQNAASRSLANYSDMGLAPGEWFLITGGSLPYPFDVAKASLQMTADGKKTTLPVSAPNGGNLQARLPVDLQAATVDLQLTYDSQPSDVATIAIKPTSFGLYTKWGTGSGPASAQNFTLGGPGPNSLVTPANPGEFVTLYGTGLGAARDVVVVVDGITVAPRYVGSAPGMAGVDQINFLMPAAGVRTVCYVPIRVQGAGWVSNEVTLSVANVGGTCTHPLQLTPTAMAHLETGGTVPVAQALMSTSIEPLTIATNVASQYERNESASVNLWWVNEQTVDAIAAPMQAQTSAGCSATATAGTTYSALLSAPPDAGKTINLNRPGGNTIAMPNNYGYYSTAFPVSTAQSIDALPPSTFPAATWTLSAPGGADVQGFAVGLAVPPPINWTNRGQLGTLSRSQDLLLTWDTAGLSEADWMTATLSQWIVLAMVDPVGGSTPSGSSANTFLAPLVAVACRVPATSGRLTIGSTFLAAFPADPSPLELTLRLSPRPDLQSVAPIHPAGSGESGAVIFTYQRELTQSVSIH